MPLRHRRSPSAPLSNTRRRVATSVSPSNGSSQHRAGSAQGGREHATGRSIRPALAGRSNPASNRAAAPPPAVSPPVSDTLCYAGAPARRRGVVHVVRGRSTPLHRSRPRRGRFLRGTVRWAASRSIRHADQPTDFRIARIPQSRPRCRWSSFREAATSSFWGQSWCTDRTHRGPMLAEGGIYPAKTSANASRRSPPTPRGGSPARPKRARDQERPRLLLAQGKQRQRPA